VGSKCIGLAGVEAQLRGMSAIQNGTAVVSQFGCSQGHASIALDLLGDATSPLCFGLRIADYELRACREYAFTAADA
jgi:hypothetical protein